MFTRKFQSAKNQAEVSEPGTEPACYSPMRIAGGLTVGVLSTRGFKSLPQRHFSFVVILCVNECHRTDT